MFECKDVMTYECVQADDSLCIASRDNDTFQIILDVSSASSSVPLLLIVFCCDFIQFVELLSTFALLLVDIRVILVVLFSFYTVLF